jgi:mannose-6-phosphate isomerase
MTSLISFSSTSVIQPEMAIALTPFRGFCGFLPLPQMLLLLSTIPEMRSLIGEAPLTALAKSVNVELAPASSDVDEALVKMAKESVKGGSVEEMKPGQKEALKGVFEVLMKASESSVKDALKSLLARYTDPSTKCATQAERDLVELVKELNSQFPDDVGVLCCFILNVVELEVGKSVFLKADEPHAYISGGEWNDGARRTKGEEAGCGIRCCRSGSRLIFGCDRWDRYHRVHGYFW